MRGYTPRQYIPTATYAGVIYTAPTVVMQSDSHSHPPVTYDRLQAAVVHAPPRITPQQVLPAPLPGAYAPVHQFSFQAPTVFANFGVGLLVGPPMTYSPAYSPYSRQNLEDPGLTPVYRIEG